MGLSNLRYIGCALPSWETFFDLSGWSFGWAVPTNENEEWAGPAFGDVWLCLGPIALMFRYV